MVPDHLHIIHQYELSDILRQFRIRQINLGLLVYPCLILF